MRLSCIALVAIAVAVTAFAGKASAAIINGSFESGDFTGWSTNGGGLSSVVTSADGKSPTDGSYFAHLSAGLGAGVYTMLSQTFSATAGQSVCGDFYFQAGDYLPFNDTGYVRLIDMDTATEIAVLAFADVASVGDFGSTPWIHFSYVLGASYANLAIELGVANIGDNGLASFVGLDNVELCDMSVVPLPAPFALAGTGLLAVCGVGVLRRRT